MMAAPTGVPPLAGGVTAVDEKPLAFGLHTSPWIAGTRALAYFGPVSVRLWVYDDQCRSRLKRLREWENAELQLLENLKAKARLLGANAIVGLDLTLDPFAQDADGRTGLHLHAVGTAALLTSAW